MTRRRRRSSSDRDGGEGRAAGRAAEPDRSEEKAGDCSDIKNLDVERKGYGFEVFDVARQVDHLASDADLAETLRLWMEMDGLTPEQALVALGRPATDDAEWSDVGQQLAELQPTILNDRRRIAASRRAWVADRKAESLGRPAGKAIR